MTGRTAQDRRRLGSAPAAPAGGARIAWCRGCAFVLAMVAGPVVAQDIPPLPSGQSVTLSEVLLDENPGALWVRFRFVAPRIARDGGDIGYDAAGPDMDTLCDEVAVPYLAHHGIAPERVVISLSDRAVPFGAPDPDATQFFEAYHLENGACIWEAF